MEFNSEYLLKMNRWWIDKSVEKGFTFQIERTAYEYCLKSLESKRITSIIGPRRVGKTTIIYQMINYLLNKGISEKNILFFNGDEPSIIMTETTIQQIIDVYFSEVLQKAPNNLEEKVYVFIDEIHFFDNWQIYIKSLYDKKYNLKIIITGSSSTYLLRNAKDSLLGRIEEVLIYPLDFKEFVRFHHEYIEKNDLVTLFEDYEGSLTDVDKIFDYFTRKKIEIEKHEMKANKLLKQYLIIGGYPEYFEVRDIVKWQKYIVDDVISKGLYRDIVTAYQINNPNALEKLLYYIAYNSGQMFSYNTISKIIGIDTATTIKYINYLKDAFLITVTDNYSPNLGKIIRTNKKLSVLDSGLINSLQKNREIDSSKEGLLVETVINEKIKKHAITNHYKNNYWRKDQKEVDIILDMRNELLPIEVKNKKRITDKDLSGLLYFGKKYKYKKALLLTKKKLDIKENIYFIPVWLYLLLS